MREAIAEALSTDVLASSNPRVGCVIVDSSGVIVGRGHHRGSGTAHAEIAALADAGDLALGATAVVTLEPCRHTGRTGPCTQALINAGIARVVYGVDDPGDVSAGGAEVLRDAGIDVVAGVEADEARWAARAWFHSLSHDRPLVTLKTAVSLDGRVADATGGPTPITGPAARAFAHEWRAQVDAIVVGTGTALQDDPSLTARPERHAGDVRQPLRVVVGRSNLPEGAHVLDDSAPTLLYQDHDVHALLADLHRRDVQHLLVEGGPTLAAAFMDAGVVDEVLWFVAPILLGDGPVAMASLTHPAPVNVRRVTVVGEDVVVEGVMDVHGHR